MKNNIFDCYGMSKNAIKEKKRRIDYQSTKV